MHPLVKEARLAGGAYLLLALAPFHLLYVPGKVIVPGDAAATAAQVLAHETMFRFAIVTAMLSSVAFVLLGLALYRLLSRVSKGYAAVMVSLVLVSATVGFMNELNNVAALTFFRGGGDFLGVFDQAQRAAMGMLFLRLHALGNFMNELFWGLWLLPFGLLVMRSRFLPRLLGVWLLLNGAAYVALSMTALLVSPRYATLGFRYAMPVLFGEMAIMLYLLIKGARVEAVAGGQAQKAG